MTRPPEDPNPAQPLPHAWWREPGRRTGSSEPVVVHLPLQVRADPTWLRVWQHGAVLSAVACTLWVTRTLYRNAHPTYDHVVGYVVKLLVAMPLLAVGCGFLAVGGYLVLRLTRWLVLQVLEPPRWER